MEKHLKIAVSFLIFIFILGLFLSLLFSYISTDAPYYLSVARDISQGGVPYKDIYLSYTPLMMYMNTFLFFIFSENHYNYFLFFQFLIIIVSIAVYYKTISKYFTPSKLTGLWLSLILGVAILSTDGNYINLEVYSILFVFLAFYFFFKESFIITGIFLALSFFCKQYGILNFIPFYFLIFLQRDRIFLKCWHLSLGGIIPLIFFLVYFVGFQEMPLLYLIDQLSGVKYLEYIAKGFPSLRDWFLGGKVFIILILWCFLLVRKNYKKTLNIALIIGILVNLAPTIIQSFQHYFLNTFPYIFLMLAFNWETEKNRIFTPVVFVSTILVAAFWFARVIKYREVYENQLQLAKFTQEFLPKNSSVFIHGNIRYLYFLNNYQNPLKKKIGYSYLSNLPNDFFKTVRVLSTSPLNFKEKEAVIINNQKFYLKL